MIQVLPKMSESITNNSSKSCAVCGSMHTYTGITKSGGHYPHWYINPDKEGTWLCARCYAIRYYVPKKKFKTKQQQYRYLSKLFSGNNNPMCGDHIANLGRTYINYFPQYKYTIGFMDFYLPDANMVLKKVVPKT